MGLAEGRQRLRTTADDPAAFTRRRSNSRSVQLPRDAFFGPTDTVAADKACGRIAAEQITPYPPGIPAVVPGERLDDAVIDYLRSGLAAGMNVPDAADTSLRTFRVAALTDTRRRPTIPAGGGDSAEPILNNPPPSQVSAN